MVVLARTKLENVHHIEVKQQHSKCLNTRDQTLSLFFGGRRGQAPCMVFFNPFHIIPVQFIPNTHNGQSVSSASGCITANYWNYNDRRTLTSLQIGA